MPSPLAMSTLQSLVKYAELHEACYNLDYDKVKNLVENNIVPVDRVALFGTKGFLHKHFKFG